jgi:hypothetical protein
MNTDESKIFQMQTVVAPVMRTAENSTDAILPRQRWRTEVRRYKVKP